MGAKTNNDVFGTAVKLISQHVIEYDYIFGIE
jgi:hypothetical protein